MDEVKAFARRQPGMFIGAAAVAGILAGRLTRSLAANAREQTESSDGAGRGSGVSPVDDSTQETAKPRPETVSPPLPGTVRQPAPEPSTTPWPGPSTNPAGEEDRDERPHTF